MAPCGTTVPPSGPPFERPGLYGDRCGLAIAVISDIGVDDKY